MPRILTTDELANLLEGKSTVEVRFEGTALFRYSQQNIAIQIAGEEKRKGVSESLARVAGLIDHRCEYYPHFVRQGQGVKFDRMSLPGFTEWFLDILTNRVTAIDTGVIIHHLVSKVILPYLRIQHADIVARFLQQLRIPRLAIIEIEDKYNHAKERSYDRRLMIYALTEVQVLKSLGAMISPLPLASSLLADFRRAEGQRYADAFVRREVMESQDPYLSVFLTRDLMNAMVASAEGIDSFYFAVADPDTSTLNVSPQQLVDAVIETAITFSEIEMYDADTKTSISLEGMWSGKTNIDWFQRRLRRRN